MFSIAWQYLAGSAFAAAIEDRTTPEWPPHPDRVFQALVAAWGERGSDANERAALEWLEALGEPEVGAPSGDAVSPAAARKVYVPVNDNLKAPEAPWPKRKERYFPSSLVGDGVCFLRWPDAHLSAHQEALSRLVRNVTYIGHSSSLVRMWLDPTPPEPTWVPATRARGVELHLRVPEPGRLAALIRDFGDNDKNNFRRPRMSGWAPYRRAAPAHTLSGDLSGRVVLLRRVAGVALQANHALGLCAGLRSRLIAQARDAGVRALVSGHAAGGMALATPHVAYFPVPFVGHEHADGHLMGIAIALPRDVTADEEQAVIEALARAMSQETDARELSLSDGSLVTFAVEDRPAPPLALRPATWVHAATTWTTATPIVLGRQAPRRHPDRDAFAREQIALCCEQVGLPRPVEVRVGDVAMLLGAPHAAAFPALPTKAGLQRRHLHAWLRFEVPVEGPVLLGAGRYRGYGLCRPINDKGQQ